MSTQSPAEVLSALAKGFDPSSGELLDATGIWQQPSIGDALRAGASALEERLERLGKITANERVTRNRFTAP